MDYRREYKYWKRKYLALKEGNGNKSKRQRGGASVDTIHFWARQMMEHCQFLFLGLEDSNYHLKEHAAQLRDDWTNFLKNTFYDKGIQVTPETVHLTEEDLKKVGNIDMEKPIKLVRDTIQFKNRVLNILKKGEWIGWIFQGMVEHMLNEANMFDRFLDGKPYTAEELIPFVNEHHATEMAATANLINPDPAQQYLIDVVRSYALCNMSFLKTNGSMAGPAPSDIAFPKNWTADDETVLKGLSPAEQATMLVISLRYSQEITDFAAVIGQKIDAKQLRSIIHPVLAHHVHREFIWFTKALQNLKTKKN